MDPPEYLARARLYEERGNWAAAKLDFQNAQDARPADNDIATAYASALQRHAEYPEATALFRKLLEKNPQDVRAANNLAFVLAQSGQSLLEAERLARSAVQREATNPLALDTLGYVLVQRKSFAEAIPLLQNARDRAGSLPAEVRREIDSHLALAYLGAQRAELKQKIVNELLESDPGLLPPPATNKPPR
jgi:Flp pilus assembly protein TadD